MRLSLYYSYLDLDFVYTSHLKCPSLQEATAYRRGFLDLDSFIAFFRSLPEFTSKVCMIEGALVSAETTDIKCTVSQIHALQTDAEITMFFEKIDCYSAGMINWVGATYCRALY